MGDTIYVYPEPSWWKRNRKWVLPLIVIGGIALFVCGIFFGVMGLIRTNDAYKQGVARALADPQVIEAFGEPVKTGTMVTGSVQTSNASGEADLAVPLSGPKGEGTLYIGAYKQAGRWNMRVLEVAVSGKEEHIQLLDDAEAREQ
jgi:hypothetical protein